MRTDPTPGSDVVRPVDESLRSCDVFAHLEPEALGRLSVGTARCRYDRRAMVFQQGDVGDCLYVVVTGSVEIAVQDPDGGVVVLAVVRAPDAFGEMAVVDGGPRVATATAREDTELVRVPRSTVLDLLTSEPSVGAALMASLVRMVRHVDEQVTDLALRRLPHRVRRHLLASVQEQRGTIVAPVGGVLEVDLRVNQTDLAREVGGSRQQVNRVLASLEGIGAIQRDGSRIVAVRPDLLVMDW